MAAPERDAPQCKASRRRHAFSSSPPQILSIAGSDPSGGAGIQADLKTFAAFGCYGMAVLTALTAQNTEGVTGIHIPPAAFFRQQLRSIFEDVSVDAIKVGMLGNQDVVRALSEEIGRANIREIPIVLDPVMVSTSGSLLLTHESIRDLITLLLPQSTLLTPNLPEAEQILKHAQAQDLSPNKSLEQLDSLKGMMSAAHDISKLGPPYVLVKGGHKALSRTNLETALTQMQITPATSASKNLGAEVYAGKWQTYDVTIIRSDSAPHALVLGAGQVSALKVITDVLYDRAEGRFTIFIKPYIDSSATHGTGCTLSSACAAVLGSHPRDADYIFDVMLAVHRSIEFVHDAISRGLQHLGAGNGPLNHISSLVPRPILAPTALDATPLCARLIAHSLPSWISYTQHPFIRQIASLTLPSNAFVYFLRQDYLFLKHYARVWASGASSFTIGSTFERIGAFAGIAAEMAKEALNHVEICKAWGITKQQLESETWESAATLAYTRFVLDVSRAGDVLELLAATGPCLLGYGEAARWIVAQQRHSPPAAAHHADEPEQKRQQGLQQWIDYYNGEEFHTVVADGIKGMERYADEDPPSVSRIASLQRIWDAAVQLEIGMWDEALHPCRQRKIYGP
jgi:hydroxymethylpyrimidine/phosphomethylpyrimidine kinase